MRAALVAGLALALPLLPLAAQDHADFVILHRADTIAVERFDRADIELTGRLERRSATGGDRIHYKATLVEDESAPLIELSAWVGTDPDDGPARQTARLIFKDDSVAVDEMSRSSLITRILPSQRAALPYLNLSVGFLELATRRLAAARVDSLAMPFFNLGGGQTVLGSARRLGADSALVRLGPVEFRLAVDGTGRIRGGTVPTQDVVIQPAAAR